MGGGLSSLSVPVLLDRIDECLIPDDREPLLNFLEALEGKLGGYFTKKEATIQFHIAGGTLILLKIMKRMIKDEVPLRMGVNIFDLQKDHTEVMLDFIKLGGLEILHKIMADHEEDLYLMAQTPNFLKIVLARGAKAAIDEIDHEAVSLQLCQKCQETVERARRIHSSSTSTRIPKASDRVNRVLLFMSNYSDKAEVIVKGLDALIYFSRNNDSKSSVKDTTMIPSVCKYVKNFKANPEVVWRAFLCLHSVAGNDPELAYDLVKLDMHELIAEIYRNFQEPRVQQQMLWLYDIMLTNYKAKQRIHISPSCMSFVNFVCVQRELKLAATGTSVKDKYVPYHVVVPLIVRQFLRETNGNVLVIDKGEDESPGYIPKRKNWNKGPQYGTVDEVHFGHAEKGLI